MFFLISFIFLLVLTVICIAAALFNTQDITFNIPFYPIVLDIPLYLFFFITLILGVLLSGIIGIGKWFHSYYDVKKLKKRIRALEDELLRDDVTKKLK